jgi:hypothetical protein
MERDVQVLKKFTYQEIVSYHISQKTGCLRNGVCFGFKNRGKDHQLPFLTDKAKDAA